MAGPLVLAPRRGRRVKSAIFVAVAIMLGVMFFFYRRRLKLALVVGGCAFGVLTAVRLVLLRDEVDRLTSLALVVAAMVLIWLLVNVVTETLARRRRARARR